jgi:predicted molibdopterin-dependent oxidoreductase YjgC
VRIVDHPLLELKSKLKPVVIEVDGKKIWAHEGEPIAAALMAHGLRVCRTTRRRQEPRGVFCGIGRCTDCVMTVDGRPNVRTCITPVKAGMKVTTQRGLGQWPISH